MGTAVVSVALAFKEYGSGPPLLILHGLFGSARNWQSMAKRLGERFRVFTVDLRNHGLSPWTGTMTIGELADDLTDFFFARGLSQAVVMGHSLGGKTAMLFALRHSGLVEQLIVVDIAPVRYAHTFLDYVQAMQAVDLASVRRRSAVDHLLAPVITDAATRKFLLQNLSARKDGRLTWRINLAAIAASMAQILDFPDVSDLEYDGRTLFVSGAESDYIGPHVHRQIYALFPQSEFAVIADAGHRVHADQPDRFFERIIDFLDSGYA
jgi:pimeloyl-ACP methyl ester carboxylesterase